MFSHAPADYRCPFCLLAAGVENESVRSLQKDIVYKNRAITAFIGARQWPNNSGHVIIISNEHFESIYDLPVTLGAQIHAAAKAIALAMKAVYGCDGISTRQHNEPAGNQDVWHYHLHVFPRYAGDELYRGGGAWMEPEERARYAERLRTWLATNEAVIEVGTFA